MNVTYKTALHYVNDLKWSVIPIRSDGSKAPLIPWKEYTARYATQEELDQWFKNTNNGMGIVCGELSGLSVLDVDSPQLPEKISQGGLVSPIHARTPRNGHHLFYQYNEKLKNWVKPTDSPFDIRTQGGYVVCAPTSGYRWCNSFFRLSQLPSFPIHLLPSDEKVVASKPKDWITQCLEQMGEGNRNAGFTSIVGRLHHDRYSPSDIMAILRPHADLVAFPIDELERIVQSVSRYPVSDEENSNVDEFLRDIKPVEWIAPGLIACGSIGFVAGLPETFKTWLLLDLAIECARGGGKWVGKFNVKPARVLFVDQERYKAETQRRFKALLGAKGIDPISLRDSLFIKCGSTTRLDLDESFRAFKSELQRTKPDLVMVDSFATFNTKNENDRKDIQMVIERVKELRQEFGCTFLFIDHEGKSVFTDKEHEEAPSAFRMVGSVGKAAAAETVFTVRKYDPQTCMVYHTKNTLAPCIESFSVSVQDVPNGVLVSSKDS